MIVWWCRTIYLYGCQTVSMVYDWSRGKACQKTEFTDGGTLCELNYDKYRWQGV